MLFTTFLLATALATAGVLGGMLLTKKQDAEPTRWSPAFTFVAVTALALIALGFALA